MDVLVRIPNETQRKLLESCPIWEHEAETFEANYDAREETCLIIEGKAIIETKDGKMYYFGKGDLVTFHPHLECTWKIIEKIRKHYIFDIDPSLSLDNPLSC